MQKKRRRKSHAWAPLKGPLVRLTMLPSPRPGLRCAGPLIWLRMLRRPVTCFDAAAPLIWLRILQRPRLGLGCRRTPDLTEDTAVSLTSLKMLDAPDLAEDAGAESLI